MCLTSLCGEELVVDKYTILKRIFHHIFFLLLEYFLLAKCLVENLGSTILEILELKIGTPKSQHIDHELEKVLENKMEENDPKELHQIRTVRVYLK